MLDMVTLFSVTEVDETIVIDKFKLIFIFAVLQLISVPIHIVL